MSRHLPDWAQAEVSLSEAEVALAQAQSHTVSTVSRWIQEDAELAPDEEGGWDIAGAQQFGTMVMDPPSQMQAIVDSRKLYWSNPYVHGIVETLVRGVFGKGYLIRATDPQVQKAWDEIALANRWRRRHQEMGRRGWRDGENFLRHTTAKGWPIRIRSLEPTSIKDPTGRFPAGIEFEPDDPEMAIRYYHTRGFDPTADVTKVGTNGNSQPIPASEIQHVKFLVDLATARGVPLLWVARNWARRLARTHEAMSFKAWIAACHVMVQRFKGASPAQLANMRTTLETDTKQYSEGTYSRRRIRPGMMKLANDQVEYEWVNPGIGAAEQQIVARALGLALCAVTGLPEFKVMGDSQNSNYASIRVAEKQGFETITFWQEIIADETRELWDAIMRDTKHMGRLDEGADTSVVIEAPPIQSADLLAFVKAMSLAFQDRAISRSTYTSSLGYDPLVEGKEREKEAAAEPEPTDETTPAPHTTPAARQRMDEPTPERGDA